MQKEARPWWAFFVSKKSSNTHPCHSRVGGVRWNCRGQHKSLLRIQKKDVVVPYRRRPTILGIRDGSGGHGTRTRNLLIANQMLSQLS